MKRKTTIILALAAVALADLAVALADPCLAASNDRLLINNSAKFPVSLTANTTGNTVFPRSIRPGQTFRVILASGSSITGKVTYSTKVDSSKVDSCSYTFSSNCISLSNGKMMKCGVVVDGKTQKVTSLSIGTLSPSSKE